MITLTDGEQILLAILVSQFVNSLRLVGVSERAYARQEAESLLAKLSGEIEALEEMFQPSKPGWREAVSEAFARQPAGIMW